MSAALSVKHYIRAVTTALRNRSLVRMIIRHLSSWRVERAIATRCDLQVIHGPFTGMHYIQLPPNRYLPGKLIGFYEEELHPYLNDILQTPYATIINVGSAEGYYAVGCAVKLPEAQVYAFEIDERWRSFCARLARANGVENRVHIFGAGTTEALQTLVSGKTLLIMDCEGCEADLLDLAAAPNLRQMDILLELHDFIRQHLTETIRARFSDSHQIAEVNFHGRDPDHYPELRFLKSAHDREQAVAERDVDMQTWFFMRART